MAGKKTARTLRSLNARELERTKLFGEKCLEPASERRTFSLETLNTSHLTLQENPEQIFWDYGLHTSLWRAEGGRGRWERGEAGARDLFAIHSIRKQRV